MSGLLALVQGGSSALDDLTNSYKSADGAAQDMAKTMQDNSKSSVEQMMGSLETTAIKVEEDFAPVIIEICNDIQNLANEFSNLSPEQQEFYAKMLLGAAAAGPFLKIIGSLTTGIGGLISIGSKVSTLFAGAEVGEVALGGLGIASGTALASLAALGVGIAGVVTYNDLLSRSVSTSTDDLNTWQKIINDVTGNIIKSKEELQKTGLVYKDFGEGVSEGFKSGIEEATKSYHDFEMELTKDNMGDKISVDNQGKLTDSINKMFDSAKSAINKKKSEIQKELSDLDTLDGSGIDENEQKVIDEAGQGFDAKLEKVNSIQKQLTDRWNKAIAEHGKLSEADVEIIKNYLRQIQQIKAEVQAENDSESLFAKNQYNERLTGISAEDASKEYADASKTVKDNFAKVRATYTTGIEDLTKLEKEANEKGNTEVAADYRKQIEEKTKAYKESIGKEQSEIREYLNMLYAKNPSLKNNMNEVTGEIFNTSDKDAQGRKEKLKSQFTELATVTETGMQHIQDANGKWHDIYVTFDEATGNITGTYDTFTGEYGGYSAKFENDVKTTGAKVKAEMEELQKSLSFNGGGIKLDADNNAINATTNQLVTKLDTVIKKADGTKTAIQDINGTKIRLEFDKDGTLINAQDVEDAINGKFENNPAVVKTKIEIDGSKVSTVDGTIKKLENLPKDKNVRINIDGEEAIMSAGKAEEKIKEIPKDKNVNINVKTDDDSTKISKIKGSVDALPDKKECKITIDGQEETNIDNVYKKLKELPPNTKTDIVINGKQITTAGEAKAKLEDIPPDTNTNINVNSDDADSKIDTTTGKAENLDNQQPNVDATANTSEADSNLDITSEKADEVGNKKPLINVTANTGSAEAGLEGILSKLEYMASHPWTAFVNMVTGGGSSTQEKYTGTTTLKTGLSHVHEHGWETANNEKVKMLGNNIAYLIGNHYSGGDGINDHMTSVNEMQKDINNAVNTRFGAVISALLNSLGNQTNILGQVANNTGDIKKNGDTATTLINNLKANSSGSFSNLSAEITNANNAKEKASNMKTEENYWVSYYTQWKKSVEDQIKNTEDKDRKEALEKQKDYLDDQLSASKDAAEKEIQVAKDTAEQQVKIAEEKKDKLTKLAEATTTAIKAQLEAEKTAAEKIVNDELTALETDFNNSISEIEADIKSQIDDIDEQIKALEDDTTQNTRDTERTDANNNINVLKTKMANTASEADKRSLQLQIEDAQKALNEKEDAWDIEDEKAALEEEKNLLSERGENQKKSLEETYNTNKAAKEQELKDTDAYYDKLLEEDSINAQARYLMLQGNNNELITLLQSYNPSWQDAGQSLADSLLNGLNSKKESIQDAVNEIVSLKDNSNDNTERNISNGYYNGNGEWVGYASGTTYNPYAGLYNVDEEGFELSDSNNSVAYVSQGAGILNHMQSKQYIQDEISKQVALMRASVLSEQESMKSLLIGSMTRNSNSSIVNNKSGDINFNVEKYYNNTDKDIEQTANELGFYANRQRTC